MYNQLVKFTKFDGEETEPKWHAIVDTDTHRTACGYAVDEGADIEGCESKATSRGGITCSNCLRVIKEFKSIKL